jgi:hypothetical protein
LIAALPMVAPLLVGPLLVGPLLDAPLSGACAQEVARPLSPADPGLDAAPPPAAPEAADPLDQTVQDAPGDQIPPAGGGAALDSLHLRLPGGAANYGKPAIWKPGRKPRKKPPYPALQPLAPYPTSAEARRALRRARTFSPGDPELVAPAPTTAALPPPVRRRLPVDDQPFAPVGIDAGLLRVKPYAESDIGYNDNPNLAVKGSPQLRGSAFAREELGLSAASDWSNHAFAGDLRLGYDDYFRAHEADAPDGDGKFLARIDVARDLKLNLDGRFGLTTQSASSPNLNNNGQSTALSAKPIIAVFGGGLGAAKTFNRLELSLRGSVERDYWQDARFADGSVQRLSLDSYNAYGLTGRASYELTPGVKPFAEATIDRRIHDSPVDTSGYMRDSNGVLARAGTTFELSRLLTGDVDIGYGQRNYRDPRLAPLRGPLFDSSLVWTVTPLTRVTLRATTSLDETTLAGSPGAVTHVGSLEIAHALLRNLTLTATAGIQDSHYQAVNIDQTLYQTGLQVEYNLTRSIVLKGSFTHQRMLSNQPGTDYTANVIMVGLRLQR